eukprot:TRINITY_DN19551_c0_g1_i1.p1 TRINITY_DN19551_c0_g1~~TRINITY_DN19551_c0_g1_i1.p1  ORF type:complete len:173 (-),score=12.05 TRINITY_DN19551_c0_g1_i1:96-614(-)
MACQALLCSQLPVSTLSCSGAWRIPRHRAATIKLSSSLSAGSTKSNNSQPFGVQKTSGVRCSHHMEDVNTEKLDELVTGVRDTPLVIDFCADWCDSCELLTEELEELAEEYDGKVKFVQVNTDQEYDLADQLEIRGLPTIMFMSKDKDRRATRVEGLLPKETIKKLIEDVEL